MVTRTAVEYDVLVVVGTDHHPFARLCDWVDEWAARSPQARCLIQFGTAPPPQHAVGVRMLPYDEVLARMRATSAIVCHGGPGTIMDARQAGRLPIVVPRQQDLGEHIDDHQVTFAARFGAAGRIRLARGREDLHRALDAAFADPASLQIEPDAPGSVGVDKLAAVIAELGRRHRSGRRRLRAAR